MVEVFLQRNVHFLGLGVEELPQGVRAIGHDGECGSSQLGQCIVELETHTVHSVSTVHLLVEQ